MVDMDLHHEEHHVQGKAHSYVVHDSLRSALFIILYILFIKSNASVITAIPLILLLIAVYSISNLSLRENMEEFKNSLSQIKSIDEIK